MANNFGVWRPRPIFVTSTFRDMHAERDYLRTRVFPELAERLRQRRCHLEPVDLRWGVETASDEQQQAKELLVLKVCLAEVRRSRPFLVGLLGDRYGWVPPAERVRAAAREAGLGAEVGARSVTDLEIDFGVLASAEQQQRCRFYFRDPLPYDLMGSSAAVYSDAHDSEAGGAGRLAALKQRIKDSLPAERVRPYHAEWDPVTQSVTGLETFGSIVLEDLWADLDAETRGQANDILRSSWSDTERWTLEQFVEDGARSFIGRDAILADLHMLATSTAGAVWAACVTGPAGAGKSALFAQLVRQLQGADVLLLAHAAGISPRSTQVDAMLRRWTEELSTATGTTSPVSDSTPSIDVESAFQSMLAHASARRRVVLIVDALDQFESTVRAQHLTWLPQAWPANARLITTAIPGTASSALAQRDGVRVQPLSALDETEGAAIARAICQRYHRTLPADVLQVLLTKRGDNDGLAAGNPLWLELAVEELNLLGGDDFTRADREFEGTAEERLNRLLVTEMQRMPGGVPALYDWMLSRAEHPTDRAWTAAWALSLVNLITVSRSGWRESDLRVLMPQLSGEHWDDLKFAALRRTFRAHIVQRGSQAQWDFSHAQMRARVSARNLGDPSIRQRLHALIADHLEQLPADDAARESELMFHVIGARDALRAARLYGDLAAFADGRELPGATQALRAHLLASMSESGTGPGIDWLCSMLDHEALAPPERELIIHRCLKELYEALENDTSARFKLGLLRTIQARQATGPAQLLNVARLNRRLGSLLLKMGNLSEATSALHAAVDASERLVAVNQAEPEFQRDLAVSVNLLGDASLAGGDVSHARTSYEQALAIVQRLCDRDPDNPVWRDDLSVSHVKVGDLLLGEGHNTAAADAYRRALQIRKGLAHRGARSPDQLLRQVCSVQTRVGNALLGAGDPSGALAEYREALDVAKDIVFRDPESPGLQRDLAVCHFRFGTALEAVGQPRDALRAHQESLDILTRLRTLDPGNLLWANDAATVYNQMGKLHLGQHRLAEALEANRQALAITEMLSGAEPGNFERKRELIASHNNLALLSRSVADETGFWRHVDACWALLESLDPEQLSSDLTFGRLRRAITEERAMRLRQEVPAIYRAERPVQVDRPMPHPAADPERAARLNIEYQRALARWNALPFWKRLTTTKPEPPAGI